MFDEGYIQLQFDEEVVNISLDQAHTVVQNLNDLGIHGLYNIEPSLN